VPASESGRHKERRQALAATYSIRVEKDGADITARFELAVPMDTGELLASFELNTEGKNLIDQFLPQKAFKGTKFYVLTKPTEDTPVTFAISTNEGWTYDGMDKLRGGKKYDDVTFES
jgi:hypothetical protein